MLYTRSLRRFLDKIDRSTKNFPKSVLNAVLTLQTGKATRAFGENGCEIDVEVFVCFGTCHGTK